MFRVDFGLVRESRDGLEYLQLDRMFRRSQDARKAAPGSPSQDGKELACWPMPKQGLCHAQCPTVTNTGVPEDASERKHLLPPAWSSSQDGAAQPPGQVDLALQHKWGTISHWLATAITGAGHADHPDIATSTPVSQVTAGTWHMDVPSMSSFALNQATPQRAAGLSALIATSGTSRVKHNWVFLTQAPNAGLQAFSRDSPGELEQLASET